MQIRTTLKLLALALALPGVAQASLCSRVHTFSDGAILTASQLNSEFNNNIDCVNSISDANIPNSAAINAKKISAGIAGSGLTRDSSTGAISVSTDGVTIETNSNQIRVKDGSITSAKLKSDASVDANRAVTTDHIRDAAITTDKLATGSVTTVKIPDANITTVKIADGAVTQAKRAALTIATSSATSQNYAGEAFASIPNMSVTLTTSGRPVWIGLIPAVADGSNSAFVGQTGGSDCIFQILRDSVEISRIEIGGSSAGYSGRHGPMSVSTIDIPSAGSHTYSLQWHPSGGTTCQGYQIRTMAYEL